MEDPGEEGELECAEGYVGCKDGLKCLYDFYICDEWYDCYDGQDGCRNGVLKYLVQIRSDGYLLVHKSESLPLRGLPYPHTCLAAGMTKWLRAPGVSGWRLVMLYFHCHETLGIQNLSVGSGWQAAVLGQRGRGGQRTDGG